jgi:acyl-coenzyme A thioesterase PaaI-like protein
MKETHMRKRKILNPYAKLEGYNCFGCSPNNHLGLQLEFFEDGDEVTSEWQPKDHFGGYKSILHGGIQATLLDEIASWTVQVKLKTAGVTANIDLRYKKTVFVNKGKILLKARIKEVAKRLVFVETELYNHQHELSCYGIIKYFVYPKEIAREKLYFPEFDKFFEE